jgi:putative spermidine/putrescine transport system permease protein
MRRIDWASVLLWSTVLAIITFILAPIGVTIAVSFSTLPFLSFPPVGFTMDWFRDAVQNEEFLDGLVLSLQLAAIAGIASTVLGTLAAIGLERGQLPLRGAVQAFLLSPLIFPMLVTGIAFLQFFSALRMEAVFWELVIAHTAITMPYVVRTVTASLQMLDPQIEAAAYSLGASRLESTLKITLPLAANGIVAGFVFAFVMSFDNFPVSMWLVNAEYKTLPLTMFSLIQRFLDPSIAAISTLTIALSIVLMLVVERLVGLRRFASGQ